MSRIGKLGLLTLLHAASCAWIAVALCGESTAAVIPPVGLTPGQQYQLMFVTFGTTDATHADIDYYNTFVNTVDISFAVANFGLPAGVTWHAVVSTPSVNARDNAPSNGLPVYNTAGQLVAASSIYAGSLLTPVYYNELGFSYDIRTAAVWTGSDPFGAGLVGHTLGDASGTSVVGFAGASDGVWTDDGTPVLQQNQWALYVLSSPITFVPEPGTLWLVIVALGVLAGARTLRRTR